MYCSGNMLRPSPTVFSSSQALTVGSAHSVRIGNGARLEMTLLEMALLDLVFP